MYMLSLWRVVPEVISITRLRNKLYAIVWASDSILPLSVRINLINVIIFVCLWTIGVIHYYQALPVKAIFKHLPNTI